MDRKHLAPITRLSTLFHKAVLKDIKKAREEGAEDGYMIGYAVCCVQSRADYLDKLKAEPDKAGLLEKAIEEGESIMAELRGFKEDLTRKQEVQEGAYQSQMTELNNAIYIYDKLVESIKQGKKTQKEGT